MKQLFLGVLVVLGIIGQAAPVSAIDADNFKIENYDIHYELSRDRDGHSYLTTTETIRALFPYFDQNHGIERAIPNSYQGHSTDLRIESVRNSVGDSWNYTTYESNGNTVVRIGDASRYVYGKNTYTIRYTQKDVTRYFENTNADEFYWDTNGTDWRVPIDNLTVTLTVDKSIAGNLTNKLACYKGFSGQGNSCELAQDSNTFTTSASGLLAGENVTIAVGFSPETFKEYEPSLMERIVAAWIVVTIVLGVVAVLIMIWLFVRWSKWSGRKKDVGSIVPEYIPPSDASLSTIATIIQPRGSVFTAQLLDFAVRHYIKIYESKEKSLFSPADYTITIVRDTSDLTAEEQEVLADMFGGMAFTGAQLELSSLRSNSTVYTAMSDNDKKLNKLVRGSYALRERNALQTSWFMKMGWVLLAAAIVSVNPVLFVASISAFICAYTLWPLTDKGVSLYRYAEGMKMYIHVAEAERLQMLQSPEGAAKVGGVDVNQPGQLLKLYERMLPYAVLFGEEKEWSKRIGDLYETSQASPDWYSGKTAFNAAVFSTAMSSFSSTATYSAPASSSSGGSSGGGSSGGGGGGGGGGGW